MALKGLARVGDTLAGVCTAHTHSTAWTGVISAATAGFTSDGLNVAAVGDEGNTSCGHHFRIVAGSSVLTGVGGKVIAREGDAVIVIEGGTGTINSGSGIVKSE
jgi:uncharacterized Zn-binding protein involved in type VI secretion